MRIWTVDETILGGPAVIQADSVWMAITVLEQKLKLMGRPQKIKPETLTPFPTDGSRYVRLWEVK